MNDPLQNSPIPASSPQRPLSSAAARARIEQEVTQQVERMPALPQIALEVLRLTREASSSARDMQRLLVQDPILIGRLLKLANSSFYARERRITGIQDAVVRLGFDAIRNLVLAASTCKMLERNMTHAGYDALGLWQHSLACAAVAQSLACHLGLPNEASGEAYVGGLLHDIGKIALDSAAQREGARFTQALAEAGSPHAAERILMGFDHSEAGERVARRWNFPAPILAAIARHHAPESEPNHGVLVGLVHVADAAVNAAGIGLLPSTRRLTQPIPEIAGLLARSGLDLPRAVAALDAEWARVREMCATLTP